MSSPPDYRRPHDPATSGRQLRNAFAVFGIDASDFETRSDAGSPRGSPSRPLSNAKRINSLPTLSNTSYDSPESHEDYDDGVQPYWERPYPEADQKGEAESSLGEDIVPPTGLQFQSDEPHKPSTSSRRTFDAQAVYPAEACLFVANLAQNVDDLTIEKDLTKFFGQYGTVFVKVKRDRKLMPYAFAQFTERKHADFALQKAWGEEIMGRYLRLERCGGNLSYIIFRKNSRMVQHDEAYNIFSKYGTIAKIEALDYDTQVKLNVPPSLLVLYEKYDPRRDVIKSFGFSSVFIIMLYDHKVGQDRSERAPGDQTFMEHYDKDRRSIFMGSLPPHTDDTLVHKLASLCGDVVSVDLRSIPGLNGGAPNVYAFVEFELPNAPDEAVRQFNGTHLEGSILRVERKRTRPTRDVRSFSNSQSLRPLPLVPPLRPHRRVGSVATTPINYQKNHRRMGSMDITPMERQINHRHMMSISGLPPIPQDAFALPPRDERPNLRHAFLSPNKMPPFNGSELDEFTPVHSPEKVGVPNYDGNNVHWGPPRIVEASPVYLSPTGSSPVSHQHNDPRTGSSADRVTTSGRSVSYAFSPAAEHAADRCENAIQEKDGAVVKGHRRGSSALHPIAPTLNLDISDSDGSNEWRTAGTLEEEAGFKEKKEKSRQKLRRSCLSEQNLKRNELCQKRFLKDHKSEEDLQAGRKSSFKSERALTPIAPEKAVPAECLPYSTLQVQTQMPPPPPPPPGGFVYVAVPYQSVAAQYSTTPHFCNFPSHQHEVYQAPPQVYQETLPAPYRAPDQTFRGESTRSVYRGARQVPYPESIETQYQGYAPAPYGERAPLYQNPQARYQGPQQVDLQGRPHASYVHLQEYREPLPASHYLTYNSMTSSSNSPMPGDSTESYHQMRQRIEAERYRRYNA
ncbi:meiotic activator rim4 [Fusarium longipes]|uniref:Meiotic activator rim4 n=1 Tax=Fusarium longipes TaxID=694270 RepID=A0A395RUT1_9HYPO|nr:meiotic activator rim4 [Fusarium longipes]